MTDKYNNMEFVKAMPRKLIMRQTLAWDKPRIEVTGSDDGMYELYLHPNDKITKTTSLKYWFGGILSEKQIERLGRLSKKNTVYLYLKFWGKK